jgi:hypothetical protein
LETDLLKSGPDKVLKRVLREHFRAVSGLPSVKCRRNPIGHRTSTLKSANKSKYVTLLLDREDFHLLLLLSPCQQLAPNSSTQPGVTRTTDDNALELESKRVLGIIPNYRTSPDPRNYVLVPTRELQVSR